MGTELLSCRAALYLHPMGVYLLSRLIPPEKMTKQQKERKQTGKELDGRETVQSEAEVNTEGNRRDCDSGKQQVSPDKPPNSYSSVLI